MDPGVITEEEHTIDHLLIPIFVNELSHWVLGIYTIKNGVIKVYDSMSGAVHDRKVLSAIEPYAVLIPHLLSVTLFYMNKKGVDFQQPLYFDTASLKPLEVKFVADLPIQSDLDCGIYVSAFAEYFICKMQIQFDFDENQYRSRLACLLWNYGLTKKNQLAESDSEYPKKILKNKIIQKRQKL